MDDAVLFEPVHEFSCLINTMESLNAAVIYP